MNTFFKILVPLSVFALLSGCAVSPSRVDYGRPSPSIEIMKETGNKRIDRRSPDSLRYDPNATLANAVQKPTYGDVMITVTFKYRAPRRGKPPRLSHCMIHVQGGDSALNDPIRCKIEPFGNTAMIYFRMGHAPKSFDLRSLGGDCMGGCPFYERTGRYYRFRINATGERNVMYVYVGPDPLK